MIDQNGGKQENHVLHRFCRWHCFVINLMKCDNVITKNEQIIFFYYKMLITVILILTTTNNYNNKQ